MKKIITLVLILSSQISATGQSWNFTQLADMPEPVANNAVVSAEVDGKQYVYSFSGIDSTKIYSGIHSRCWRYDVEQNVWESLPGLPDPLGRIAAGACVVNGVAYVFGGYHVLANDNEITIEKVHRLDLSTNTWMADGMPIPKPVDDHVQAVWRDSLIYLATGWSTNNNVANVQIYNPSEDSWLVATSVPNSSTYKVFGASGAFLNDTLYYLGGAKISGNQFLASTDLRQGIVDSDDPTSISWTVMNVGMPAYRSAATLVNNQLYWLGGSDVTYNYNGIAYNGSGGVARNEVSQVFDADLQRFKRVDGFENMPMDLRGLAEISATERILAGGMEDGQKVSRKTWLLTWEFDDVLPTNDLSSDQQIEVFPNPLQISEPITIYTDGLSGLLDIGIYNSAGKLVYLDKVGDSGRMILDWRAKRAGIYFLKIGEQILPLAIY